MKTNTKNIEVQDEEVLKPKKKQAISKSYTVKAFTKNVERLKEINYLKDGEIEQLETIKENLIKQLIKDEY